MTGNSAYRRYLTLAALIMFFVASCFTGSNQVAAQQVDLGDFVRTGIGARALAMGGAAVALGGDSSSAFWNPAGMTELGHSRFGGMYTDRFSAGIIYQYLSGIGVVDFEDTQPQTAPNSLSPNNGFLPNLTRSSPIKGKLSAGLTRIGMDIGELSYSTGSPVGESRTLWLGSAAYRLPGDTFLGEISLGASFKRYQRTLNEDSVSGWGYDLGILYTSDLGPKEFPLFGQVGFALQDPGGVDLKATNNVDIEPSGVIPQYNRAGLVLEYRSALPTLISVEYDFSPARPQLNRMSLGTEVSFAKILFLRAGVNGWLREESFQFTVGAGIEVGRFIVNYAYLPHQTLGGTHVISSDFRF